MYFSLRPGRFSITNMSQALILPQYPGDFSLDGHTHNYASASHSHSQYLTSHQSLTNYATKTYVDNAVAGIDTSTVPSHSHSNYASSSHTHSYASTSHTHNGYASSSHTHSSSDITGLSTGGSSGGGSPFESLDVPWNKSPHTLSKAASYCLLITSSTRGSGTASSTSYGLTFVTRGKSVLIVQYNGEWARDTVELSSDGKTLTVSNANAIGVAFA